MGGTVWTEISIISQAQNNDELFVDPFTGNYVSTKMSIKETEAQVKVWFNGYLKAEKKAKEHNKQLNHQKNIERLTIDYTYNCNCCFDVNMYNASHPFGKLTPLYENPWKD